MDSRWSPGDTAVDDELEVLGAAVRATLVRPVDPAIADEHVRRMVAAYRPSRLRWARRRGAPGRVRTVHRPWWPAIVTAVAAAVVAAAMTGSLPRPVQDRLASAAGAVGIHLPRHHVGRATRVSTPRPPVDTTVVRPRPSAVVTTVPPSIPSTTATLGPPTTAVVAPPVAPPLAPPSTPPPVRALAPTSVVAPPPATTAAPAPATTAAPAPATTVPPGTTTTTRSPTGCVNPVLVSVTATLVGTQTVAVVIQTTGTVPYMSVDIAGATGVSANLQPTADGFRGTVTATSPIIAGTSVLEVGSCGGQIRGTAVIQA
jgi:hypothetical protein